MKDIEKFNRKLQAEIRDGTHETLYQAGFRQMSYRINYHPCNSRGELLKAYKTLAGAKRSCGVTPEAIAAGVTFCDVAEVADGRILKMWRWKSGCWQRMVFVSHGGHHGEWRLP